ncbi:hypothetical protein K2173_009696 [Erythroxylum novogranatense]|uniref:Uncharacterized protein n=1 Tax=Erythroxylum novogranatense TaxID=1862640 RepID=A0AAV8U4S1_9ROSI|nr:hypothetical protein K2173_009696 [Erythroxylum novogranatense]
MAHFGNLSDTDDSAVDELISQVQELSVLEQVSKINCSGFDNSLLPTDLETRFRKLKSFPVSNPRNQTNDIALSKCEMGNISDRERLNFSAEKHYADGKVGSLKVTHDTEGNKLGTEKESESGYASSSLNSSISSEDEEIFRPNPSGKGVSKKKSEDESACKQKPEKKISSKSRPRHGSSGSSRLSSSPSLMDSPSPPRKSGCFWCSPKKKRSKEHWSPSWVDIGDDNFLSDLNIMSVKQQKKIMKKSMRLETKISRDAEKIARLAKQASERIGFHGIEDDLSGDDSGK